ncbi:MAG: diguanylate cyclase [Candidatus Omnitrophica bacterium]|nr:diguanylate cyclase [Candidatus Omnitrophota bacterium]
MSHKGTVLVVDDEPDILEVLDKQLSGNGYEVRLARDGREALEKANQTFPDVLILDIGMPVMDGIQLKASLNRNEFTAGIPTIFLSATTDTARKVEGFNLGADDYITKPFEIKELLARVDSAVLRHRRYVRLSMTDKLTGLYNLHVYEKHLNNLFHVAKRYRRVFSLAILDIDNLKSINDTLGHKTGDFVIQKVAETMRLVFRKSDILIRYGGDEFVVLLPESSEEQAANAIRRLKKEMQNKTFAMEGLGQKIRISVSCGFAAYREGFREEDELFRIADQNLYHEKSQKKTGTQLP